MSFSSFSNFGFQKKKTFPIVIPTVSNGNFASYAIQSNSGGGDGYVYIYGSTSTPPDALTLNDTLLPSWVVSTPTGTNVIMSTSGASPFYPTDTTYQNSNVLSVQFASGYSNISSTLSQNVNLAVGTRTLSFYASGQKQNKSANFSVSLGQTTLNSPIRVSSTNFTLYTYTYEATSNGIYPLVFTFINPTINYNTMNITNVKIT